MNILITGHTHGLGAALCDHYLAAGATVYGLARSRRPAQPRLAQVTVDFAEPTRVPAALDALLAPTLPLQCVYLNAGVLGPIAALRDTPLATLTTVMDINVWANKLVLDWLLGCTPAPRQVVLLSSGASQSGHYGWGAYALSKATLNMLTRLYAHEFPHTHLCALAPGLVATAMQTTLAQADAAVFPSLTRLQTAHGTPAMASPAATASRIIDSLPFLRTQSSGAYVDLRTARPADQD